MDVLNHTLKAQRSLMRLRSTARVSSGMFKKQVEIFGSNAGFGRNFSAYVFRVITITFLAMFSFALIPANAQGTPAPPTFSPVYGIYPTSTFVTLSAPSGTIYYTLDGSQPSATNGIVYSEPLPTPQSEQINAIVIVSGVSSAVATAWYAFDTNAYSIPTSNNTTPSPNLLLWLRGDFGPVVTSGNISLWGDVSLSENTAQAVSPTQPTLQTNSVNGLPAVTFVPGSNGQFLSVPSAVSNFTSGLSVFVVARPSALSSSAQLFSIGSGSLSSSVGLSENASFQPTFSVYNGSGTATTLSGTAAFSTNQFQLYEIIQSGTTATMYVNGSQVSQNTTMNALPTASTTSSFIGKSTAGGNYFTGQIAELLLYSTPLTLPQKSYIESYLIQKYQLGIPIQAPVISVPGGTLTGPTMVAISAPATETIHITLDGSMPTAASPVYTAPINVYYSQTLNAIAVDGTNLSTVSSAAYVLNPLLYPAPSTGGDPLQLNLTLPSPAIP